jgi:hypothetical protein
MQRLTASKLSPLNRLHCLIRSYFSTPLTNTKSTKRGKASTNTNVGYGSGSGTSANIELNENKKIIDMRSDTVTKPTPDMLHAMQTAALGDDVYGEDPTVNELESTAAKIFGKDAALFVPTGTMGNLLGILSHTNGAFGAEMIVGDQQHTYLYEQGGASSIGGVHSCVLPNQPDGTIKLEDIGMIFMFNF